MAASSFTNLEIPDDHDMSGDRTGQEHFVYAPMDIPTDHSLLGDRTVQSQCSNAPGDIHIIQASAMKAQTLSNNAELFRITSFELLELWPENSLLFRKGDLFLGLAKKLFGTSLSPSPLPRRGHGIGAYEFITMV